jgi:hypothetical protein
MAISMRDYSTALPSGVDSEVVSIETDKSTVTLSVHDDEEEPLLLSGPSRTLSAGSRAAGSTAKKSGQRLSFKTSDEFFHGMLSYRVRTEGPKDSGGNNLARLIYEACCNFRDTKNEKSETPSSENLRHFFQALQNFGKWPKVFSGQSQIRLFLDQANLRMGVPWKGTGDADSGGFLGAVSQALVLVPLLSANPAPFKIVCSRCRGVVQKICFGIPDKHEAEERHRNFINRNRHNGRLFAVIPAQMFSPMEALDCLMYPRMFRPHGFTRNSTFFPHRIFYRQTAPARVGPWPIC